MKTIKSTPLTQQELYSSYFDGINPTAKTYNKIGVFAKAIIEDWIEERRTL